MSPTSYRTAPPRISIVATTADRVKPRGYGWITEEIRAGSQSLARAGGKALAREGNDFIALLSNKFKPGRPYAGGRAAALLLHLLDQLHKLRHGVQAQQGQEPT